MRGENGGFFTRILCGDPLVAAGTARLRVSSTHHAPNSVEKKTPNNLETDTEENSSRVKSRDKSLRIARFYRVQPDQVNSQLSDIA
jgi:hypothetical protein